MSVRVRSHARVLTFTALAGALLSAGCAKGVDDASGIVRTTTAVAGAEVIGVARDTRTACALPSAPDSGAARRVAGVAGQTAVPADPQRIVVLDTRALDATCALGLWTRVVGATTLDGPRPQPRYLGTGVKRIVSVGSLGAPDPDRIRALRPDLIIGTAPAGAGTPAALSTIAPTVFTGSAHGWQQEFLDLAAAMNRADAAARALADYHRKAVQAGRAAAPATASQAQVSVVRFTADQLTVEGDDSFAGQVLADIGVGRPQTQRGASYPLNPGADLGKAEGDLIFAIVDGEPGKNYGEKIMNSDSWRDLGASDDHRVFVVDESVWNGDALTAAAALVDDLTTNLNQYGS
jgi:iron complex transport system substrate-binding protein